MRGGKRKFDAASGAHKFDAGHVPEFVDDVPVPIFKKVHKWRGWRESHPVRANGGRGLEIFSVQVGSRASEKTQSPWYAFEMKDVQQWLYVPRLVPADGVYSKPLAGAPEEAKLTRVVDVNGEQMRYLMRSMLV